jgi:predicted AAA+ superfamily ATPase
MVERDIQPRFRRALRTFPVVTLTGPRQSGKSTLCRLVLPERPCANLEEPDTRAFATEDPRRFLAQFPNGAIIDEVQRCPDLPSYLQPLVDANPKAGRWILTGSQNLSVLASVGQSLAGRSAVLHLLPLAWSEVVRFKRHPVTLDEALLAGGYPRILDKRLAPADWFASYVATFVERDVRSLSNIADLAAFTRFIQLCAGRTAQLLNLSALAADAAVSQPTAKAWLSVMEASFIAFRLQPWHGNLGKRLIKAPKLHFYDAGLACWLLGIRNTAQLHSHPLRGAIFETWVVTEILKHRTNRGETTGLYFYRDAQQREVDAVIESPGRFTLVEAKSGETIRTKLLDPVRAVAAVLAKRGGIDSLTVVGGGVGQRRSDVAVVPWNELHLHGATLARSK